LVRSVKAGFSALLLISSLILCQELLSNATARLKIRLRQSDALMRVTNASALVTFTSPSFTPTMTRLPRSPSTTPWSSDLPSMTTLLVRFHAHLTPSKELIHSQELRNNASAIPRDTSPLRMTSDTTNNTGLSKVLSQCLKLRSPLSSLKLSRLPPLRRPSQRPSRSRTPAQMLFQLLARFVTTIALPIPRGPLPLKSLNARL